MKLPIVENKVLLIGNRGHKNMGDEIILVGNIKLLLNDNKKIYIACSNKNWLKSFHKQFVEKYGLKENNIGFYNPKTGEQIIVYLQELPKGFRSTLKFLKNIKDLKFYFQTDSILIGGGEIFTEETPGSYWYWLASVWPFLLTKTLYLSGGIQIPKKFINKIPFKILTNNAKKLLLRDYEFQVRTGNLKAKSQFFPDTSFFVYDNLNFENYTWNVKFAPKEHIIVNVNKKAEKFYPQIEKIIAENYGKNPLYFAWVCKSPADNDIVYYEKLSKKFPNLKLLDWEDWEKFISIVGTAQKVYTTRLHLFLISYYLGCSVEPFEYEKKVKKMKQVLNVKIRNENRGKN